jgi:hypothetical protein
MDEKIIRILTEEMDEETLSQMPLWFRTLRDSYMKTNGNHALSKDVC